MDGFSGGFNRGLEYCTGAASCISRTTARDIVREDPTMYAVALRKKSVLRGIEREKGAEGGRWWGCWVERDW